MARRSITTAFLGVLLASGAPHTVRADTPRLAKPATPAGNAVFPAAVNHKYASETAGKARMHTCLDQYHANKASHANGSLKWIQSGGGYYSLCSKKLKG